MFVLLLGYLIIVIKLFRGGRIGYYGGFSSCFFVWEIVGFDRGCGF